MSKGRKANGQLRKGYTIKSGRVVKASAKKKRRSSSRKKKGGRKRRRLLF